MTETTPKSNRGFASMSPEKRREIAQRGGRSVPNERRSFSLDPAMASAAGCKGGLANSKRKAAES